MWREFEKVSAKGWTPPPNSLSTAGRYSESPISRPQSGGRVMRDVVEFEAQSSAALSEKSCARAVAPNASTRTKARKKPAVLRNWPRPRRRLDATTMAAAIAIHNRAARPPRGEGDREQPVAVPPTCLYFS